MAGGWLPAAEARFVRPQPNRALAHGVGARMVGPVCSEDRRMKAVVIGQASGATMDQIMAVYPRHKLVVERFIARGEVIGIGPFTDLGNMGIFRTRAAAEQFAREDPYILEGLVKSPVIRDWDDKMLA